METNETLDRVHQHLTERNLIGALDEMDTFLAAHPNQADSDRLFAIRTDFRLMADYWRQGYKDPQMETLFGNLLRRMYVVYANVAKGYAIGHSSYLSSVYMHIHMTARDWSPQTVRAEMEGYVSEVAMLDLLPDNKRQERQTQLNTAHQRAMDILFDYLWTSSVWSDGMGDAIEEILLSPTIDASDLQLMVSGITLALLNHFDMAKFRVLINVYRRSDNEHVRQRALVGWVLAADSRVGKALYPELKELVGTVLDDEHCCQELVELQKQIVFCMNAEQDNQTIQKEIMPDLLRGNQFRVTRNGIEEVEEDPMEDILHPEAQEQKIEQMEESFERMVEMQKQGSDIYFGGFSQMKRFPFFNETSNWFVPFHLHHPAIAPIIGKFGSNRFLQEFVGKGPFCDSDKYSFVYAFEQVVSRIPKNLLDMLERGEASVGDVLGEERNSAAYIRRMYLQDLYRFFRVFPRRSEFSIPFSDGRSLFFASDVFRQGRLEPLFGEVAAFLMKRRKMHEAGEVLSNYRTDMRDFQFYMMAGYLTQHRHFTFYGEEEGDTPDGLNDLNCYRQALALRPGHEKALTGYARALFNRERYEEALSAYDQLLTLQPDKANYHLNRSVCLTNLGQYEASEAVLYRLNYESPDDKNVKRVLAWTLACDGKCEQAERHYDQLLADNPIADDVLNFGYCLWFGGRIDQAADCFRRYLSETKADKLSVLESEAELLSRKGITEPERQMMLYQL